MQFERDCLNMKVLPTVNELAKKYGDSVNLCDLRWGINTYGLDEDVSNKKILDACLQEIDNCRPYMIVFLGERYGWVPGKSLIQRAIDNCSNLSLSDYDISVTALEIEYGAFFSPEQFSRTLFYFRENTENPPEGYTESEGAIRDKLTALKERIKSIGGAHVHSYSLKWNEKGEKPEGLDALAERITKDLCALFSEEWEKTARLTECERENLIQTAYAQKNAQTYYTRHTRLEFCKYLLDRKQPFFVITEGDGAGKTALISKLACDRAEEGIAVIPVFCGLTATTCDSVKIIKYVIESLKNRFGGDFSVLDTEKEGDINYWKKQFAVAVMLCDRVPDKIELYFDEVDFLCADSITTLPFFCKDIPENVSIVFSCAQKRYLPEECPCLGAIDRADYFDTKNVMKNQLKGARKELDDIVLQEIFYKKNSANPLYLKLILLRLALLNRADFEKIAEGGGDIAAIIEYQKKVVENCPDALEEMCELLVKTVCDGINPRLGKYIADCIFSSYRGLSEEWLKILAERRNLEWSPLDFRLIMQFLDGLISRRSDGKYDLVYNLLKTSYKGSASVYADIMGLITEQEELSDEDASAYIYCCICSENPAEYTRFLLSHPEKRRAVAKSTFSSLQHKLYNGYSESPKTDFMIKWIRAVLKEAFKLDGVDEIDGFFRHEYNEACTSNAYYWRIMANEVFGDWDTVNSIEYTAEKEDCLPENCYESFKELEYTWKEKQKSIHQKTRREHLVAQDFREFEFEARGHKFYFFNIPRRDDSQLFFMRDDKVLIAFYRSSVGDHCTYDVLYDGESGILTVTESDFCHYDVESDISVYTFENPFDDEPEYTLVHDTVRGAHNLPLYFKVKR